MKFIHTSDWHLGHTLYNFDRTEEQSSMLAQIREVMERETPDALLISGDVYHTSQPSAGVQKLFTEAMMAMHAASPDTIIIVTAGNHDSAAKHEIFRTPWRALNVVCIGTMNKDNLNEQVIPIAGKGVVIALPYCHPRNMPENAMDKLMEIAKQIRREMDPEEQLPIVVMAHTTMRGCNFTGHDNASDYMVGGIDYIESDDICEGYDYVALGHIHHPQYIKGTSHKMRYSGSPLPVSFDETYSHSISIVNIDAAGEQPKIEVQEIKNPRPLVTLPADGFADLETVLEMLKEFPKDLPAYLRLNVEVEDFLPANAFSEAEMAINKKKCRMCHINPRRKAITTATNRTLTIEEFKEEKPIDIAKRISEDTGFDFSAEMEEMFKEAVAALEN